MEKFRCFHCQQWVFVFLLVLFSALILGTLRGVGVKAEAGDCQSLTYPCREGSILFPNDEGKHEDRQVEWWYANFNVNVPSSLAPLAGAVALVRVNKGTYDQGYALLEITNERDQEFYYRTLAGSISSTTERQNIVFLASPGTEVGEIRFYQDERDFQYKLEILGNGIDVKLTLTSQKRPLVEGGDGYVPIFANHPEIESGYYSLTNLQVSDGIVTLPDTPTFTVNGLAWIDHQWLNLPSGLSGDYDPYLLRPHHEWFSVQLQNNVQLVAWEIFREITPGELRLTLKNLDVIDAAGEQTHDENFFLDPTEYWDPGDGKFAQAWRLKKGDKIDLVIQSSIPNQYVSPYRTYEGSTTVSGTYRGVNISGEGFAEMTLRYPSVCQPSEEVCDGLDNDCDFRIDEFCLGVTPTPSLTPTPTPSCPRSDLGNLTCDPGGLIDEADLSVLLGYWCSPNMPPCETQGDLDNDNDVDEEDLKILLNNWKI